MLMGYDGSFLNDERWITVKGTHVRLDKNGRPNSGPKKLRKVLEGKGRSEKSERRVGPPKDVTAEYRKNAKPGRGRIIEGPGYKIDDSPKGKLERSTAEWLVSTFGGNVTMNKQTNAKGEDGRNPEYTWNGKSWELKEPERPTLNSMKNNLREGLHQIRENPGGVLMDITKCGASFDLAVRGVTERARQSAHFDVDVIIIKRGDDYRVLRFKEKKETEQEGS